MALDTINKCLSEAICALFRGRLDGESQTAGLIHSGNEIWRHTIIIRMSGHIEIHTLFCCSHTWLCLAWMLVIFFYRLIFIYENFRSRT